MFDTTALTYTLKTASAGVPSGEVAYFESKLFHEEGSGGSPKPPAAKFFWQIGSDLVLFKAFLQCKLA